MTIKQGIQGILLPFHLSDALKVLWTFLTLINQSSHHKSNLSLPVQIALFKFKVYTISF
jgi:hypothetical protein